MEKNQANELTALLRAWGEGDVEARDRLIPLVYDEMKRIAGAHLRRESNQDGLQTAALVNEVYLKLTQLPVPNLKAKGQFFGMVARLMRQILVDHYRTRSAEKRGNGVIFVRFDKVEAFSGYNAVDVFEFEDLLNRLGQKSPRWRNVVELRVFCGFSTVEIAEALEVSQRTVLRDWRDASVWLRRELTQS
jgi:RNA polymerase sigma factor (TIGR02999 family)